ncbi:eukaryotic translation elongation factor 1 epsilon-1 isoform X4 [Macaca nemestrina]|uniref:eukaryotic translation elongation factor 1 epsilon-1 isoform X4 n=1 Tax=Macaca nemestrina TaxID=9545 RepID=UPI0039B9C06E
MAKRTPKESWPNLGDSGKAFLKPWGINLSVRPTENEIPVLQTNNGPSLTGLTTIAAHLVKQANKEYLLGSTAEEKAIVQQWLEYRVTQIDGHSSKNDIHTLLKDLNSYLEDKVYLTGYNFTLADILLYYGLHRFIFMQVLQ